MINPQQPAIINLTHQERIVISDLIEPLGLACARLSNSMRWGYFGTGVHQIEGLLFGINDVTVLKSMKPSSGNASVYPKIPAPPQTTLGWPVPILVRAYMKDQFILGIWLNLAYFQFQEKSLDVKSLIRPFLDFPRPGVYLGKISLFS